MTIILYFHSILYNSIRGQKIQLIMIKHMRAKSRPWQLYLISIPDSTSKYMFTSVLLCTHIPRIIVCTSNWIRYTWQRLWSRMFNDLLKIIRSAVESNWYYDYKYSFGSMYTDTLGSMKKTSTYFLYRCSYWRTVWKQWGCRLHI